MQSFEYNLFSKNIIQIENSNKMKFLIALLALACAASGLNLPKPSIKPASEDMIAYVNKVGHWTVRLTIFL
jgi:hypothetical protein